MNNPDYNQPCPLVARYCYFYFKSPRNRKGGPDFFSFFRKSQLDHNSNLYLKQL